ncbi:MAG: phosphoribosylformylglycinamidine cyclo-ligase [Acidimicrobiales bacterium]|nr:MAG: phosphoribosylformylglycinamidine cyclo-ligase [Acidimicrobiales bacterium]
MNNATRGRNAEAASAAWSSSGDVSTYTSPSGITYAESGVDLEAGDRAVELFKPKARKTFRPEVVGDLGGFASLFALDISKFSKPLLASSTDGVGTKLVVAQRMDIHDTVGIDLVAMVVDDLVVCGAEPLFLQDYIACGSVVPEKLSVIVGGIADGCRYAGCALTGGEIAEHGGVMHPNDYDLSATGVGVVNADRVLGGDRIVAGDALIAMRSSGLHSNGYSLVRRVLLDNAAFRLDAVVADLGRQRTLGEELLTPTQIYSPDCLAMMEEIDVRAFVHITGGGIPGNVARLLGHDVDAVIDRSTWQPAPVFELIASTGSVAAAEMERTFNMGVGMVAVVPAEQVRPALGLLAARHRDAWVLGEVVAGRGQVRSVSKHPMRG